MQLSEAEWKVMSVAWTHGEVTARDVLEELEPETGWAYTTVKTMLARLTQKDALTETKNRNRSVYRPTFTREAARRSALHSLLDRAFEGTFGSLFHHLVDEERLSAKDRRALEAALNAERDRKTGAK